ncbi:MAG TPA: response regulator transcription factor, partial [Acidimicrobiia bacterium]|nr:response regulator transcription factor [Acidimicrobiia bacterium]
IVDDVEDVRAVLRLQFKLDGRFEVIGEGEDGEEAIELARELRPDLLVLDRNMPLLGGLEAIARVRAVSPDTAIVLYTAALDKGLYHDALAAGALDVLDKAAGPEFVEHFTARLLDSASVDDSGVEVRVGPVSGNAARTWIANTRLIIDAVGAHPEVVEVSSEAIQLFQDLLAEWHAVASDAEEFLWVVRAQLDDVTAIVEQWAVIDLMTDAQLEQLGVHWSPPEGQPFFEALTTGVLRALDRHSGSQRLAARLAEQWAPWRQGSDRF